ncbi:sugar transferase [Bacteroides nordii]|uniref:sugar transferase n=1 Tax=Bacteroides nordii TaxID=291645 RepID=UPI002040E252|nr:sugar transferase [Bacteroides nordii]GFZ41307.1 glycosyl transferase [Bacteroides nordii]
MVYRFFKRLFDVICALLGIIGTSPIWILSIILTEVSDSGPLFYFANRVGEDNKKFKMWKFRSMRVARGASEASLRPDQDRIFWWGKVMRRLKIDELPQLMNILNGTMSIVGPRPAAVDQVDITRGGENAIVATVPCGLTSQSSLWDYIYGDQFPDEEEYNEKVLPIRLKLDIYYVQHVSFFGDIKLIWWTVLAILYTACGKYPQWMHEKLVEYSRTV